MSSEQPQTDSPEQVGLSPEQQKMFDKADVILKTTRFSGPDGIKDQELQVTGNIEINGEVCWVSLLKTGPIDPNDPGKFGSKDYTYYAFLKKGDASAEDSRGEGAKKLFDFYEPIARLKTKPEEVTPVQPEQPGEKSLEDQLLGG